MSIHVQKHSMRIIIYAGLLTLMWLALYSAHFLSALKIWVISETYHHCLSVIPLVCYMVWKKQEQLKNIQIQPSYWPLLPCLVIAFFELIATAGNIQVISHIATFVTIPFLAWSLLGTHYCKAIFLPLSLFIFAIPIGEEIVPQLQNITAQGASWILRLIGVPIFKNGLFLEIPQGRFVVAEACSGIKFFITATYFGAVYAYFTFKNRSFILSFIFLSALIAIAANILRVFVIIMIGRHFGMEHASGSDHIMYGWLLFVVIIILLISTGEVLRKYEKSIKQNEHKSINSEYRIPNNAPAVVILSLLSFFLWKTFVIQSSVNKPAFLQPEFERLVSTQKVPKWQPDFPGASSATLYTTRTKSNANDIYVYFAWHSGNDESREMISSENSLFPKKTWSIFHHQDLSLNKHDSFNIKYLEIVSATGVKRSIAYWYMLPNYKSANAIKIKLSQAFNKFIGRTTAGVVVVISTKTDSNNEKTKAILIDQAKQLNTELDSTISLH